MSFDKKAKNWDADLKKTARAKVIAKEIVGFIRPDPTLHALEFGCGTGLLSFQLRNSFNTITLVDNSVGMIQVLQEKITEAGIKNFKPIHIDLLEEGNSTSDFDVIYTLMTLHHITDMNKILEVFNTKMKLGGFLCIADLVQEDGSFHAEYDDFAGHNGFDRESLSELLSNNGFSIEYDKICFEIKKQVGSETKKYPLFLMICKKINRK